MSAVGIGPAIGASPSPSPVPARSSSNLSSPLSDVEDKDQDPDSMDLDARSEESGNTAGVMPSADAEDNADESQTASRSGSAEDSNLSELDEELDTEAETERLYDTPQKSSGENRFSNRRLLSREHSPGHLDPDADAGAVTPKKADQPATSARATELRKRKRSSDHPDAEEPPRKKTPSASGEDGKTNGKGSQKDPMDPPTQTARNAQFVAKRETRAASSLVDDYPDDSIAELGQDDATMALEPDSRDKNGREDEHEEASGALGHESDTLEAAEDAEGNAEEETADMDGEEEAEAVHKTDEELERRKLAWEQLTTIEKQFATFRDRLYQERLDQLRQEEAMLTGDNPTHPEYLAMMQCIDARRDERMRVLELEHKLRTDVLKKRATAERAQILSQFFQSVRETREKVLEDLGRQWYDIQHERRRYVNSIPDYGLRYPTTRAYSVRYAVAYNKEVSILSGIAKHRGFPAAPDIAGADVTEIEDDFEAISRARDASQDAAPTAQQPFSEYGSMSMGRNLGPAGEQFLEQTPWANPNHPSHHGQRQNSLQAQSSIASHHAASEARRASLPHGAYGFGLGSAGADMSGEKTVASLSDVPSRDLVVGGPAV